MTPKHTDSPAGSPEGEATAGADDPFQADVKAALRLLDNLVYAKGLTKQDLDRALHATRGYSSRVLSGETRLTYETILRILDVLGLDPTLFFDTLHHKRQPAPAGYLRRREDRTDDIWRRRGLGEVPRAEQLEPRRREHSDLDLRILEAVRLVLVERGLDLADGEPPTREE
jgi:transcriptional regulator with XRE-family HTH domain